MEGTLRTPHTKGMDTMEFMGNNPCAEIALGEPQECTLGPIPEPAQTQGLRRDERILMAGHMHVRSNSEPGIHLIHIGTYTTRKIEYNEGRS